MFLFCFSVVSTLVQYGPLAFFVLCNIAISCFVLFRQAVRLASIVLASMPGLLVDYTASIDKSPIHLRVLRPSLFAFAIYSSILMSLHVRLVTNYCAPTN